MRREVHNRPAMFRLLLAALVITIAVTLLSLAVRSLIETTAVARQKVGPVTLGKTPMQRLCFVLLVALIFYAAIWGSG